MDAAREVGQLSTISFSGPGRMDNLLASQVPPPPPVFRICSF